MGSAWDQFPVADEAPDIYRPDAAPPMGAPPAKPAAPDAQGFDQFAPAPDTQDPAFDPQAYAQDHNIGPVQNEETGVNVRWSPEQEAHYYELLKSGATKQQILDWENSTGTGIITSNLDEVLAARDAKKPIGGIHYELPAAPDNGASDATATGMVAGVPFADKADAALRTLGIDPNPNDRENIWNSDRSFGDIYNRNVDINHSIMDAAEANHPVATGIGNLLSGLAIPLGLEGVGLAAGKAALKEGATMAEARAVAAQAVTKRMAQTGAAYGGSDSFNRSRGDLAEKTGAGVLGAMVGGGTGAALGKVGEIIAPRVVAKVAAERAAPVAEADATKFANAADRQGIDYLAADVPGATKSRFATAVAGMTLGGIPLADAAEKTIATARAARDTLAQKMGFATDKTGAGAAAIKGAKSFMATSEERGGKLYDAIPIAGGRPATLNNTQGALSELNAGLVSNPELSALISDPRLKAFEDAFTGKTENVPTGLLDADGNPITRPVKKGGQLSWADLKAFRTYIGEKAGSPALQSDTSQRALKVLYGALSQDMAATASAEGPKALTAFNRANQYWRGRQARIDGVITDILGPDGLKSPQPSFEAIERLAKENGGDAIKLAKVLRTLPEDEANTVRATILGRMGNTSKGRQNMDGDMFSPADFATHWNNMSERARNILFQGDHRRDLNDIAMVMDGMKASSKFANVSKTGIAVNATAMATQGMAHPFLTALYGGLQFGGGMLLANPRFAKWVAAAAKKPNPAAQLAHVNALTALAKAEPAIANNVLNLQERLASVFSNGGEGARLAADESPDHSTGITSEQQKAQGNVSEDAPQ